MGRKCCRSRALDRLDAEDWGHWGQRGHQQRRGFRCPQVPSPGWGQMGTMLPRCGIRSCKFQRFVPICPHLSPGSGCRKAQCWRCVPIVPSVPIENAQVSTIPPVRADLAGEPTGAGVNICAGCLHLLPRGSRGESQSAGLLAHVQGFGIALLAHGQGEACPAFTGTVRPSACNRSTRPSTCLGLRLAAAMCR